MRPDRPGSPDVDGFRSALLAFYDERRRDLPWRQDADPYRVWVSEIMLQQTRVQAVIPYYERWLERFPTVLSLADADPDDVLRTWEGLGYYSRARNLQRAARIVRDRHDGSVPEDPSALRSLPGIGDYTAGAIASIAFGHAEPAVDGNVRRVLARLFDEADPDPRTTRRRAARLVPSDRPGDFNQALMELGATVCLPRAPRCDTCPVDRFCRARANGTQAERPAPRQRQPVPEFDIGTAVIRDLEGRLLLARNGPGLLAGLWSFPGEARHGRERPSTAARRSAVALLPGVELTRARALGTVVHPFTHRKETYHAYTFELRSTASGRAADTVVGGSTSPVESASSAPASAMGDTAWVHPRTLGRYALPVAQRRIAALAGRA